MTINQKTKRRGLVLTGGGAKGFYEAGVIYALHITGMEFDVITGSSIGAFNSLFYAEYLLRKKHKRQSLGQLTCAELVEEMDDLVRAYHHAWLQMPDKQIIDDSKEGSLGQLKDDLLKFNLNLPQITRLAWWWTDPDKKSLASIEVWPAAIKLFNELKERLGGARELLRILKYPRNQWLDKSVRTYLDRFGILRSLVSPEDDSKFASIFTTPIQPLQLEYLKDNKPGPVNKESNLVNVIQDENRTLKDYYAEGIDIRLTRANYRTGRLEISSYFSIQNFVRYLEKQAWRLRVDDPMKIPLGSFRLHIPGNPKAINAALASGRFPGVLAPYPIEKIYPSQDPENALLYKILAEWFQNQDVQLKMTEAYYSLYEDKKGKPWRKFDDWRDSESMHAFFPHADDVYVDGGAIDNTPSNSAIDATREWIEANGRSNREVVLDLYLVFLSTEPLIEHEMIEDPALYQVVKRTLDIMGTAKQSSDAVVVDSINTFGERADKLGNVLLALLESYQKALALLSPDQQTKFLDELRAALKDKGLSRFPKGKSQDFSERIGAGANEIIRERLPLHVNIVRIYPKEMPLDTLQFTERLGYEKGNAVKMLTMGCYQTLWSLHKNLEMGKKDNTLDSHDEGVLQLTRKWMGIEVLPDEIVEQGNLNPNWHCTRTNCVYHPYHCLHGEQKGVV